MYYVLHHGSLDKRREKEEEGEKEKEKDLMRRHYRTAEGRERDSYSPTNNGEITQNDVDQVRYKRNNVPSIKYIIAKMDKKKFILCNLILQTHKSINL